MTASNSVPFFIYEEIFRAGSALTMECAFVRIKGRCKEGFLWEI